MNKIVLWPFVVIGLSLASHAQAQIGRTLAECEQKYGKPEVVSVDGGYMFGGQKIPEIHPSAPDSGVYAPELNYFVLAEFVDGKVSELTYMISSSQEKMYVLDAEYLLHDCAPEAAWNEPTKHAEHADVYWDGIVNGAVKYHAHLQGSLMLEVTDEATNVGGVKGAKREIINGQSVTVLPTPKD
jgi:hypothetical protein